MKNVLISFFKVSGLTMIAGISSFIVLLILFNDLLNEGILLIVLAMFLGGFTVFISFLIMYLPIFYLNKNLFEKDTTNSLYDRFLPLVLMPITVLCSVVMLSSPRDFFDSIVLVVVITGYIITCFSFYQFIRLMKDHYDNRNQL